MKYLLLAFTLSTSVYAADAGFEARQGEAARQQSTERMSQTNQRLNRLLNSCTSVFYPEYGRVADIRSARNRRVQVSGMRMDTTLGWIGMFGERSEGEERHSVTFSFTDPNGRAQQFTNCSYAITRGDDPRINISDCNYPSGYNGPRRFQCGHGHSTTRINPCRRHHCDDRSLSGQVDKPSSRDSDSPAGARGASN